MTAAEALEHPWIASLTTASATRRRTSSSEVDGDTTDSSDDERRVFLKSRSASEAARSVANIIKQVSRFGCGFLPASLTSVTASVAQLLISSNL